jgi:citrate lyase subunit beta/citryl-CoA lyase
VTSNAAARPDVRSARSWLFVPGDRGERFAKAVASGADMVVCDLEDAVALSAKAEARAVVSGWLGSGGTACVRLNAHGTASYDADVAALTRLPGLAAVMLPKAEDPQSVLELTEALGPDTPVVALVESALGLRRAFDLASAPGVARLAFGSIDMALDLGAEDDCLPMLFARSCLVVSSRAAGVEAPVDGVTPSLDDPSAVATAAAAAARMGFGGKLCIHPSQVPIVNTAFRPSEQDVQHARRVLASGTSGGAGRWDGQLVDRPVLERARRVLGRAEFPGMDPSGRTS